MAGFAALRVHITKGGFTVKSHPFAATAHLCFDDALPRPTASVPLSFPYPCDCLPASGSSSPTPVEGWGLDEHSNASPMELK